MDTEAPLSHLGGSKAWALEAMDACTRRQTMRDIAEHVAYLKANDVPVPDCWFLHRRVCQHLAELMLWWEDTRTDAKATAEGAFGWWRYGVETFRGFDFRSHTEHRPAGAEAHLLTEQVPTPSLDEWLASPAFEELWSEPKVGEEAA
ncbi:MAG TPA: hypothetical protein VNN74_09825 [Candidatus Micrarchaeia archaeon]|nr:hypothetical protein [Candidatus Micrarchaeia archaeon]